MARRNRDLPNPRHITIDRFRFDSISEYSEIEMAQADNTSKIDSIWKALRLVPEFDGNSHVLVRFLHICDKLVLEYVHPDEQLVSSALLNGIINKITGKAARTLATNGIPDNWQGIRNTLVNSFSDHRDECSLYTDLSLLTQGTDTASVFYDRVQNMLSTIMAYVQLHESVTTTIEAKRQLYNKLALKTFTRGLHEPIGSRVRCMRPETLKKLWSSHRRRLMCSIFKTRATSSKIQKKAASYQKPNNQPPRFVPPLHNQPRPNFIPNSYNGNFIPQPSPMQRPQLQGPSKTQQAMRALPRADISTGFRISPRNKPQNGPVPMSGISHPVARNLPLTGQTDRRQVNLNETDDYYNYDQTDNSDYSQYLPEDYFPENTPENMEQHNTENFQEAKDVNFPE